MSATDIAEVLRNKAKKVEQKKLIPSGWDLLDILLGGGYATGEVAGAIGDSSSGKSLCAVELIHQAIKLYGDRVEIRYNDIENGMKFNTEELYGYSLDNSKVRTKLIEDFVPDILNWAEKFKTKDKLGVYVLDSWDALRSKDDKDEVEERQKKYKKDETYDKGSYGMKKQKFASEKMTFVMDTIEKYNVVLFVIQQIRDNINGGPFSPSFTISGGNAIKFFTSMRLFYRRKEDFKRTGSDGIERSTGYCAEVFGLKTRCAWPNRKYFLNFDYEIGPDNVSTNIDYLYGLKDERGKLNTSKAQSLSWSDDGEVKEVTDSDIKEFADEVGILDSLKEEGTRYTPKRAMDLINRDESIRNAYIEKFKVMDRDMLIKYIEDNDLEEELTRRVYEKVYAAEESVTTGRKRKH